MLNILNTRIHLGGRTLKAFAKKNDLVYFGQVNDSENPIKGVSFDSRRHDEHFVQGHLKGRDISLLLRSLKLKYPLENKKHIVWTICEAHLQPELKLPHIFLDAHKHDENFYKNLFAKFSAYRQANMVIAHTDKQFTERFDIYCPPDVVDSVTYYFKPDLTSQLAQSGVYDIEVYDNKLLLLQDYEITNHAELQRIINDLLLLADQLEDALLE